jgi:hypothetical protein
MSERRLSIKSYGEGRFAVFEGEGLMVVTDTLAEAEAAKKRWQGQIDAGGTPTTSAGQLASIEVEALRTETTERIERLEAQSPRRTGSEGGKKPKTMKRDWRPYANGVAAGMWHDNKKIKALTSSTRSRLSGRQAGRRLFPIERWRILAPISWKRMVWRERNKFSAFRNKGL